MKLTGRVAQIGVKEIHMEHLKENKKDKRTLGRPIHNYADNFELDQREDGAVENGLIWLKVWVSGWLFWREE
jgi:hypothetical protein